MAAAYGSGLAILGPTRIGKQRLPPDTEQRAGPLSIVSRKNQSVHTVCSKYSKEGNSALMFTKGPSVTSVVLILFVCLSVSDPTYGQANTVSVSVGTTKALTIGSAPTQVFHARIEGDAGLAAPSGYAELFYSQPGGNVRSELSIPIKAPKSAGRIYAENNNSVRTGVAFSNPNPFDLGMTFYFTDSTGTNFGNGTTLVPANGQIARS